VSENASDDRELEHLFATELALTRRYRAVSQEEPPAALDQLIRAAARREVRRARLAGPPFGASWRVPLSIAAVVVVSATITLMVAERDGRAPVPASRPGPASGPAPGEAKDRTETPSMPLALGRQPAPTGAKAEAKARASRSSEMVAGTSLETRDPLSIRPGPRDELLPPTAEQAAEQPAPAKVPSAPQAPSPTKGPATTPASVAPEQGRADTAASQVEVSVNEALAAKVAPVGPMHEERASSQPTAAAEERAGAQAFAKKQAGLSSESTASPWEKDPQAWLTHIDALRTAGRNADAAASFRAFRSRYPDYRLPTGFIAPGP